jgi:phosphomannomutase
MLDPTVQKRVDAWLKGDYDAETKSAIRTMMEKDPRALTDAFYTDLSFGTGGIRALMGVGTNRLNRYTIRIATQGLANYILKSPHDVPTLGVAIGYDSRHHSKEFAEETARVIAGNGINVYLFPEIRPTPYTSFACRHLKCQAAVMITASHNPKEYNGYKVYWSDGAQVVPPHDTGIIAEVEKITGPEMVKLAPLNSPLIHYTDQKLDSAYLEAISTLELDKTRNEKEGKKLKIAYTSLHGTGITLAPKALTSWGFPTIEYVEKQIIPDGEFPTVKFPNPEYAETLKMGLDLLQAKQCDILLANDPDADRIGVAVLHKGKPVILTGNEIACICVDYLCSKKKPLSPKDAVITTIVSTPLLSKIASSANISYFEVLTGFKYIGEKIHLWETSKNGLQFLFGAEESYGYLIGTFARDKDAIVSSCLIASIALANKLEGKTLVDHLNSIYDRLGIHREGQRSISFPPGREGSTKITSMMQRLRKNPPQQFCGKKVLILEDYLEKKSHDLVSGKTIPLTLPSSDVLLFRLDSGWRIVIRPSGTEPKVKVYGSVCSPPKTSSIEACDKDLESLLQAAEEDLKK